MVSFNPDHVSATLAANVIQGPQYNVNGGVERGDPGTRFHGAWRDFSRDIGSLLAEGVGVMPGDAESINKTKLAVALEARDSQGDFSGYDSVAHLVEDRALNALDLEHQFKYAYTDIDAVNKNFLVHLDSLISHSLKAIYLDRLTNSEMMAVPSRGLNQDEESTMILSRLYEKPDDLISYNTQLFKKLSDQCTSTNPLIAFAAIKLISHVDFQSIPTDRKPAVEIFLYNIYTTNTNPVNRAFALVSLARLQDSGYKLTCFFDKDYELLACDDQFDGICKQYIAALLNKPRTCETLFQYPANTNAELLVAGVVGLSELYDPFQSLNGDRVVDLLASILASYDKFYAGINELVENRCRENQAYFTTDGLLRNAAAEFLGRNLGERQGRYKELEKSAQAFGTTLITNLAHWDGDRFSDCKVDLQILLSSLMSSSWDAKKAYAEVRKVASKPHEDLEAAKFMETGTEQVIARFEELLIPFFDF